MIELLSVRAPAPDVKLKLLKEIAEEHGLDWDPSASESELSKTHEDLLVSCFYFLFKLRGCLVYNFIMRMVMEMNTGQLWWLLRILDDQCTFIILLTR